MQIETLSDSKEKESGKKKETKEKSVLELSEEQLKALDLEERIRMYNLFLDF
jgi:hypothetical protein